MKTDDNRHSAIAGGRFEVNARGLICLMGGWKKQLMMRMLPNERREHILRYNISREQIKYKRRHAGVNIAKPYSFEAKAY